MCIMVMHKYNQSFLPKVVDFCVGVIRPHVPTGALPPDPTGEFRPADPYFRSLPRKKFSSYTTVANNCRLAAFIHIL